MAGGQTITFREQIDGFPFVQVALVAIVRLAEPIAFTSLFPYVFFMVKRFGIAENEYDISKYSGYLATVFAGCQVMFAIQWGKAADRLGRKRVVMTGMIGTGIAMLILGFSTNYWMAFAARALMGCVNGNVSIIRSILGEVRGLSKKNEALAFLVMPLMFQLGSVIGPALGGSLTNHEKPTGFKLLDDLNEKYPFALVNIVVSGFLFFSATMAFFFIEETHYHFKYEYDVGLATGDKILGFFGVKNERLWAIKKREHDAEVQSPATEETPLLSNAEAIADENSDSEASSVENSYPPLSRRQSEVLIRTNSIKYNPDHSKSVPWGKIITPNLVNIGLLFFIQNIQDIVFTEFLPIFLSYDLMKDGDGNLLSKFPFHILGGLGFDSEQSGRLLSTTGFVGIFVILVVFPWVDRNFNTRKILTIFLSLVPLCFFFLPYVVFLAPSASNGITSYKYCFIAIYCLAFIRTSCSSNIKPHLSLITHRGAPKEYKAVVNSIIVTIASSSRAIGPLIWGHIFSFAQEHEIFWLFWWSLFFFSGAGFIQSFFIDTYDFDDEPETTPTERVETAISGTPANR
ncbi:hypothetical protein DASC09_060360 [Saccharomycopsis crataegensis]|uniref:Major facilitator superfamily (MFS) profile domain-containing protein n=1 Tax=Saccharomycopsis crataegensis TaxID=43959 RepID=A0AAV5QUV2_9ASCO|nr:hypothetical protein DASC09_060360 [Saccharomycopsis crataegensis]